MEDFRVKRIFIFVLCMMLSITSLSVPLAVEAAKADINEVELQATTGIVMDAETGQILGGKNINKALYPASTTKILTALIVLENCELDEVVTFSQNAVYNVDVGSTNINSETGDKLTVEECLYALLLHSANEVANALAEHVAGSIEQFTVLMNEKAKELGCTDSNFANPSGLNNPEHYVTAKDMALIAKEAYFNKTFMKIQGAAYYDLPKTIRNKEGLRIYNKHKLFNENSSVYYEGCLGGKTGYTMLAKNTLVTYAKRDDQSLIAVVLHADNTHYEDTKKLLDYGYKNYKVVNVEELPVIQEQMQTILEKEQYSIKDNRELKLLLPKDYNEESLEVKLAESAENIAEDTTNMIISYNENELLSIEVIKNVEEAEASPVQEDVIENENDQSEDSNIFVWCAGFIVVIVIIYIIYRKSHYKRYR